MLTPTPWTIYDDVDPLKIGIKGFDRKIGGMHVATVIMPENAELIVRAVNNHDALVKALREILEANKDFRDGLPQSWDGDPLQDACDAAQGLLGRVERTP